MMGTQNIQWWEQKNMNDATHEKRLLKPIGGTREEQHERWKLQYKAVESIIWYCSFKTNYNKYSRQCYTLSSELSWLQSSYTVQVWTRK